MVCVRARAKDTSIRQDASHSANLPAHGDTSFMSDINMPAGLALAFNVAMRHPRVEHQFFLPGPLRANVSEHTLRVRGRHVACRVHDV